MGEIGGTVGTTISAAFLFLIALINIIFLVQAVKAKNCLQHTEARLGEEEARPIQGGGLMVRIIGPVLKAVDKPWKLYPVGLLFGLGALKYFASVQIDLFRLRYGLLYCSTCHFGPRSERPKWPITQPCSHNHSACQSLSPQCRKVQ